MPPEQTAPNFRVELVRSPNLSDAEQRRRLAKVWDILGLPGARQEVPDGKGPSRRLGESEQRDPHLRAMS